ncbi:MAG: molybdopterin-binding protein [Actinomycetota bacterium]
MKTVEILAAGNELLQGIVQESNSHWLAKRIAARGASLVRVTVLPDEPPVVAQELRAAIARAPSLIVTHGGLGPTDDDRTREAIAMALDAPQALHSEAEAIVRRRYAELAAQGAVGDAHLTPARLRMAMLPQGARALDNAVGAAPGIVVKAGPVTIVALPGVPPELFWIWEHSLAPVLDELLGPGGFAEITLELDLLDESRIAELLASVQHAHPRVYVKSRARGFEAGDEIRVTLAASGADDARAHRRVEVALAELRTGLAAVGIAIRA